jgi:hypothetical protein
MQQQALDGPRCIVETELRTDPALVVMWWRTVASKKSIYRSLYLYL